MKQWFVAQAVRNREMAAALSVAELGMNAYVPSIRRQCKRGFRIVEETVPRFGVYVFVQFDKDVDQWGKLWRMPGRSYKRPYFERVLCNVDGVPSPVPDAAMQAIRDYSPPSEETLMPHVYRPGERVTCFIAGVRREAVFVEYCGARPFIRTWIFGADRVTEVSSAELEPLFLDSGVVLSAIARD